MKNLTIIVTVLAIATIGYFAWRAPQTAPIDGVPQNVTLTGTYTCLPHSDPTKPHTEECRFGIKTDDGKYYAVNFGQSATAMDQFRSGARITAEGNIFAKEALSSSEWQAYTMEGIFTITGKTTVEQPITQGKLDINAICNGALMYMTFTDGASADAFVKDCIDGKHPEVIERYKADMNLGDGATM